MNLEDVKIEVLGQYLVLKKHIGEFSTEEIEKEYNRKHDIRQDKIDKKYKARLDKYYEEAKMMFDLGYYKGNLVTVQVPISIPMVDHITDNQWTLSGTVLDYPDSVFGMVPWFHATNNVTGNSRYFHKHSLGCPVVTRLKEPNKTFEENINSKIIKHTSHSLFFE